VFETTESRSLADRRADASRDAIVDAAWRLSRANGLTGWSLRELAAAVGVKAPTLYAYVDSKHAIYDLMFRQGWEEMHRVTDRVRALTADTADPRAVFTEAMVQFVEACTSDPTRYHLLFQRVIPDFDPSPESYAASLAYYERFREQLALLGVTDDADLDLWTAVSTGLVDQQISNDPGGDRWARLIPAAIDMYCDHLGIATTAPNDKGAST
jgi:AcrR family transcriptional regulator